MAGKDFDPAEPPCLYLVSAFVAMEPSSSVISLARECDGGSVTERVQRFLWDHCIKAVLNSHAPYVKNLLKKLIHEVELENGQVLDEIYEQYAHYMTSLKDDKMVKVTTRVFKTISFLFSDGSYGLQSCPKTRKLLVPLQCSLNMLEGDTGCSLWPSSLFMSEFILSFPDIFFSKSCLEVGSGAGLVGICLAQAGASEVILTDGDLLTLANMKQNLEMNHLDYETALPGDAWNAQKLVRCLHLPWESASESELQFLNPDIILGADVIYDPSYIPHLTQVLSILLNHHKPCPETHVQTSHHTKAEEDIHNSTRALNSGARQEARVAYIASVIRNINTFNYFLELVDQYGLSITDMTGKLVPFDFLLYMNSYDRSSVKLLAISRKQ